MYAPPSEPAAMKPKRKKHKRLSGKLRKEKNLKIEMDLVRDNILRLVEQLGRTLSKEGMHIIKTASLQELNKILNSLDKKIDNNSITAFDSNLYGISKRKGITK